MIVNTELLRAGASIIEGKNKQYEQEWARLYTEADSLVNTNFKSEASTAFKQKLDGYKDDFERLGTVIGEYVEFLNSIANEYEKILEEDKRKAESLSVGK